MANKYVRGLIFTTGSTTARISYILKMMYEFWGFCVFGSNALATPGPGALAGSTTIAAGSNGASLPQATINVVSTAGAPTSGTIFVHTSTGSHAVTYTGKNATQFTGCTGGTGVMSTGNVVNSFAATSVPGNFIGASTVIAVASNGASLPQATINVTSTATFPTSGTIFVYTSQGTQQVTYTGTTATTFTGCSGGAGTMSTGNNVTSSSLMTIGSDGYTNASIGWRADGYTDFYAASGPFTSNMIGKQLITWKNGSGSTEDSIYNIIAYKDPTNIVININSGGTPSSENDGYRPSATTRSSINYRVIDVASAATLPSIVGDGSFIVFQFDPTGVNSGQANPQLQFTIANSGLSPRMDYRMSASGTWNGSTFPSDASATLQPSQGSANAFTQYQNTVSVGNVTITMIGDKSFMLGYAKDSAHSSSAGFHWHCEIPDRLYSQSQDPNPFAVQINGYNSISLTPINAASFSGNTTSNGTYLGGFVMRCNDGGYRHHRVTVRALIGDGGPNQVSSAYNVQNIPGPGLIDFRVFGNIETGGLLSSYAFLSSPRNSSGNPEVGQYSLARCRLRNVRFANNLMARFTRFRSNGDFILLTHGVAWPWDNCVIPITLFPF